MGKRLLTKDYNDIVFETFKMPERDYFKYYSNIIDKNYKHNSDIIQELELAINNWIDWYKSKIDYSPVWEVKIKKKEPNPEEAYIKYPQKYKRPLKGKKLNPEETYIPLFTEFGIQRDINRAFFDDQLKIIHIIGSIIDSKNQILKLENKLPEPLREILKEIPFPDGFDYENIKRRFEIIKKAPEIYITKLEKLFKELKVKQDEINKTSKQSDLTGFKSSLTDPQIETTI